MMTMRAERSDCEGACDVVMAPAFHPFLHAVGMRRGVAVAYPSVVRRIVERLVMVLTVSFLVLAVAQSEPSSLVFAGIAAIALCAVLAARYAAVVIRAHEITVGSRARQHRESLVGMPEPQHPDTAGRPRTRAPSQATAVA
jgi:hypothetical protein